MKFNSTNNKRYKPLERRFVISNCHQSVDYVCVHDLNKESGMAYFIDEVYEATQSVVAVILINSADNVTLSSHLLPQDEFQIRIPVYVVTSLDGTSIMHHIIKATTSTESTCYCEFNFDLSTTSSLEHQSLPGNSFNK